MAMDEASVAAYLREAEAPVAAKKLHAELGRLERWPKERVASAVAEAVGSGAVFVWPRFRGAVRYWHRDPAKETRETALRLASEMAMPKRALVADVAAKCFRCGTAAADNAVRELVRDGALRSARPMGPSALLYATPEALVRGSMALLKQRLSGLGIEMHPGAAPVAEPAADRILAAVARLQPGPSAPVAVRSLRAAVPDLNKDAFDRAVIELADRQQLYLTTHDHGWALPESERQELVSDGSQKLYVAVTLRDRFPARLHSQSVQRCCRRFRVG